VVHLCKGGEDWVVNGTDKDFPSFVYSPGGARIGIYDGEGDLQYSIPGLISCHPGLFRLVSGTFCCCRLGLVWMLACLLALVSFRLVSGSTPDEHIFEGWSDGCMAPADRQMEGRKDYAAVALRCAIHDSRRQKEETRPRLWNRIKRMRKQAKNQKNRTQGKERGHRAVGLGRRYASMQAMEEKKIVAM
jgi:hypothetical protein